ncbi:MAG: PP2C family serine/threonine-protein phosphatase [Acidiferrobacterales bacterium]
MTTKDLRFGGVSGTAKETNNPGAMKYQITDCSVRGSRPVNQDRFGFAERSNSVLLVLADGLGGHAGGELAAELLVQAVIHAYQSIKQPMVSQPSAFLALAILHAHRAINAMGKAQTPPLQPRTTCVVCLVQDGYAYWAHVGDSRLYLYRNNEVVRRTKDHTIIEKLRQEGVLSEQDMVEHPEKNRLLKCVGGPREPSVALGEETVLMPGDKLLLCTDGLWEAMSAEDMQQYINRDDLEDAVIDMLITAENKMGSSSDNISAACLRWEDELTSKPPLQTNVKAEVDQKTMRSIVAKKRTLGSPVEPATVSEEKPLTASRKKKPRTSLENEIENLESFLDDFLPKG